MKVYNRFLLSLVIALGIANGALALGGQTQLDVYIITDAIIFLIVALFFNFNPRAMSVLRIIGGFVFVGFLFLVVIKIIYMM